jgi:hypothetical protein
LLAKGGVIGLVGSWHILRFRFYHSAPVSAKSKKPQAVFRISSGGSARNFWRSRKFADFGASRSGLRNQ